MPRDLGRSGATQPKLLSNNLKSSYSETTTVTHTNCSRGTVWSSDRIRSMNAIQDLGVALSGGDAANLCMECKQLYPFILYVHS